MSLNNFPTGFDWGDGVTNLPTQPFGAGGFGKFGTPLPAGALTVAFPLGNTSQEPEENPDSPEIERAEQATVMHTFTMAWDDGVQMIYGLGRGTFLEDSRGNITRILSSKIKRKKPGQCEITIIAESISFDTPPDEFQIDPVDLGLDIIKNPRYSWALAPISTDSTPSITVGDIQINLVSIKSSIIRLIQSYRDAPFFPSADQINGLIQNNVMDQVSNGYCNVHIPNPDFDLSKPTSPTNPDGSFNPPEWDGTTANKPTGNYPYAIVKVPVNLSDNTDPVTIAMAAAKEIISKLWRQEDTPYLTGWQIRWTQYFFAPPYLNPGGYIENPVTVVPSYFLQPQTLQTSLARGDFASPFTNQDTVSPITPGSDTIFDNITSFNPQSYATDGLKGGPLNISWLRKADEVIYQRTWFAKTSCWVGSPIGNWDTDFYSGGNRPQNADDFDKLI